MPVFLNCFMYMCVYYVAYHKLDSSTLFNIMPCSSGYYIAFHLSVNGQKSVRARVTLFHQLQAKHQIPIKKSVKNKLMTT